MCPDIRIFQRSSSSPSSSWRTIRPQAYIDRMRIVPVRVSLFGILLFIPLTVSAQDTSVARRGERIRVATSANDSIVDGRLSWIAGDSLAVWRTSAPTVLSVDGIRSLHVQRRPEGYARRTMVAAATLGAVGAVLGAHLGKCKRGGAPTGAIDLSCDTPDSRARAPVFAVIGAIAGAGVGWLVQTFIEPRQWVPARIPSR